MPRTTPKPRQPKGNGTRKKLTVKQELFKEAVVGVAKGNGTQAARLAGYNGSDATLAQVAYENLRKPEIAEAVEERLETAKKCMSADEVLEHLTDIGEAAWREFVAVKMADGTPLSVQMRLGDKLKALELLARHHKLLTDNLVISGKVSLLDAIRSAGGDDG